MRSIIFAASVNWRRVAGFCLWAGLGLPLLASAVVLPPGTQPAPETTLHIAPKTPPDCSIGKSLSFVAHPDDDLLFMNPDLDDAIQQRQCVQVVYLTAGDRGEGMPYTLARERGLMGAYSLMAGVENAWNTDGLTVGAHTLVRHTLRANPRVQLIMLRLPDPWLGSGWGSLTPMSQLESVPDIQVTSYEPYHHTYTRDGLVHMLADLIHQEKPQIVRLMDPSITIPYQKMCWRCTGHDHPDHIAGARLVVDAMKLAPGTYTRTIYLNYPTQERQTNLDPAQTARKTEIFMRYAIDDTKMCPPGKSCTKPAGPEASWVSRKYYVEQAVASPTPVGATPTLQASSVP